MHKDEPTNPMLVVMKDKEGIPTGSKILEMEGDGMVPTIHPGQLLWGHRLEPTFTGFIDDEVYVFRAEWGGITVKRVRSVETPNGKAGLLFWPDNEDIIAFLITRERFEAEWETIAHLPYPYTGF